MSKSKITENPVLVYVEDDKVQDFKDKYINYEVEEFGESTKYEDRITFLGTTGQLSSRRNLYGHNVQYIDKSNYKQYVGITSSDPNYNTLFFVDDGDKKGVAIVTRGKLYINNPYWIEFVDELPETQVEDTIYLIKE